MDRLHYEEMICNVNILDKNSQINNREIYLFGHCNATETLADLLRDRGYTIAGILDNNNDKQGNDYKGIMVFPPNKILGGEQSKKIVCIASRAYEAMVRQLRQIGYFGRIEKMVDYNSFAEYSLSEDIIVCKKERLHRGLVLLHQIREKYPGHFIVLCPFEALGDVFLAMSYLPHFLRIRQIKNCIVCVSGNACRQVAELFEPYPVRAYAQKDLDELIQACIYVDDGKCFIAHQDRPYVVKLHSVLYVKCIPLETIYKCGIFGLPRETEPYRPTNWQEYTDIVNIVPGKTVIFSPYAKSVPVFDDTFWNPIVENYKKRGFLCLTNVAEGEKPLLGTYAVSAPIAQMQSLAECAGTFIGIRSGLCDIIRYADCKKIALYPDYNYSDTKWKAIDIYALGGWENIAVNRDFVWNL